MHVYRVSGVSASNTIYKLRSSQPERIESEASGEEGRDRAGEEVERKNGGGGSEQCRGKRTWTST